MGGGVSGRAGAHQARSGSPLAYKANSSGATGAIRLVGGGLTTPMKRIGAQGWHLFFSSPKRGTRRKRSTSTSPRSVSLREGITPVGPGRKASGPSRTSRRKPSSRSRWATGKNAERVTRSPRDRGAIGIAQRPRHDRHVRQAPNRDADGAQASRHHLCRNQAAGE